MRPIRLILQAFGPFAERQEIDFRRSLDQRLFGFYGETGGGKTSILDGLCFALFGESSGLERRGEDLRSHHVGSDVETIVEFVFELGEKRYFIRRQPEQTIKARRGSGETKRPHAAQLYDATAIDLDRLTSENCGDLLAERVSHVAEKIGEILGYQAPQFRQVVLLPQGQFRELLVAKSDERSKILRRLFDVSLYEQLVEALKQEAQALDAQVKNARLSIGTHLAHHGLNDLGALSTLIATSRAEKDAAELDRVRCDAIKTQTTHVLHAAKGVAEKFDEQTNAQAALAAIELKEPAISMLRIRARHADQARSVVPLDIRLKEKAAILHGATLSLQTAKSKQVDAQNSFNMASTVLKASHSDGPKRETLAREVVLLAEIAQRLTAALPVRDEALRSKKLAATARASFDSSEKHAFAAEATYEAARKSEAEAHKRQTRIAQLLGLVSDALRDVEGSKNYALAEADMARKQAEFIRAEKSLTTETAALAAAQQYLLDTEAALSKVQAVHLASKLVNGEPCSVCGSSHHPAPAVGSAESKGLNKAFEDARTAKQAIDQKERKAHLQFSQAKASFDAAHVHFAALSKPKATTGEAEKTLTAAQSELSTLQSLPTSEAAAESVADANRKWTDARQHLERERGAKDDTASAAIACAQRLESAFLEIPENFRSPEAISAARRTAEDNSNFVRQRHEAAITAEREAQRALDVAVTSLQEQVIAHNNATRAEIEAHADFNAAIAALGWSQDNYARAKVDVAQHETMTQQIQAFNADVKSSRDRLDRAKFAIKDLVHPDLPALMFAAQEASAAAESAQERYSQVAAGLTQQEVTEKRCNEIKQGMEEAEARYAVAGDLKAMTNGDNEHRMSLVDYAIAATFEDVLEAANTRFIRMSRGRFTMLRRSEMKDGRSRAGLDIIVHDNNTDRPRDAHTLSGGESFMAALSLALGLSDVVQQRAGGIKLDVIFIDEGFGSLDDQTLDNALSTLRDLVGNNRAVGVISHVEMVKQQIQAGFEISRGSRGSQVRQRAMM